MRALLFQILPLVLIATQFVIVPESRAALISYEGFAYPVGAFATGANPGSSWGSTWTVGPNGSPSVSAGSLTGPLDASTSTGNSFSFSTSSTGGGGGNTASITLANAYQFNMSEEGTVRYASFLANKSSIAASGSEFMQLSFRNSNRTAWIFGLSSTEGGFLTTGLGSANFHQSNFYKANETVLFVSKIVTSASGADQFYLSWYGEDEEVPLAEPTNWMHVTSYVDNSTETITRLDLAAGTAANTQFRFDEIRLGTSWNAVVPEPSQALLSVLAGAALLVRRKRP